MTDRENYEAFMDQYGRLVYSVNPIEFEEGIKALRALAERGNIWANVKLYHTLREHFGMDYTEAETWIDRLTQLYAEDPDRFDSRALLYIGNIVTDIRSKGMRLQNQDEASTGEMVAWFARSLSKGEWIAGVRLLGSYFHAPSSLNDEGFAWCVRILDDDNSDSRLSCIDYVLHYLGKLAEQGHAPSQYLLGVISVKGDIFARSDEKAAEWFSKAAEQGYDRAVRAMKEYRRDGNFLALVTREYLEPDDYDAPDPFEGFL